VAQSVSFLIEPRSLPLAVLIRSPINLKWWSGKYIVVVGAGNSAAEAAIDLAAYRLEVGTDLAGWRDNVVSLVIRSNFNRES